MKCKSSNRLDVSRRSFLKWSAAAAAIQFVPRHVLGGAGLTPPSEKLNMASIGVRGMGGGDLNAFSTESIVAICDVDENHLNAAGQEHPKAQRFKDYRKLLEKVGHEIDAVNIATPDHMHFPIAMAAMELGKHVYVQKPMANTIAKARKMATFAREKNLVTQMGIQMHSTEGNFLTSEWVKSGIIGTVREVACWTDRPTYPQGMMALPKPAPVPATLDWELWRGDAADYAYSPAFLPAIWRAWYAFGCGALGDMGTHIFDFVSFALDLGVPSSIEAETSGLSPVSYPKSSKVTYEFPARGEKPPVKLTWYDGNRLPPRPPDLEPEREFKPIMSGCLIYGDKATLMIQDYSPRIIPAQKMRDLKASMPKKFLPRVEGGHYQNFVRACKGQDKTVTPFSYADPLTEIVLAGTIAQRLPGRKLTYDPVTMTFPGNPDATAFISHTLPKA